MKTAYLLACVLPSAAIAQTTPEGMMLDGLGRLGAQNSISIETTGTEMRGNRTVDVKATIGFEYKPFENDVRIEVMTFEDGKIVSRQAGDGTTLWDFDARANSFSSTSYGSSDNGLANDWKLRFFRTIRLRTSGVTSFTFRLLDEAFGVSTSSGHWLPWIPTASVERVDTNILCKADTPNRNELTYLFSGSDQDGFTLTGATYDQFRSTGSGTVKHWDTTITTGKLPDNTDFGFVPPRGAKMVSVEQHLGGGN